MAQRISTKKIAIDKAYATIVVAVAAAAFVVVFSLVASKALLDQRSYQSKVIGAKKTALMTLENNLVAADQLGSSYLEFMGATTNVLGGNPLGDADRDGDNARIVLDALPSKYDFPAMTTSIDKLLRDQGFPPAVITGTDNEAAYSAAGNIPAPDTSSSPSVDSPFSNGDATVNTPISVGVVEMPFTVEVAASNRKGKDLMRLFERSIRPINIQKLTLEGNGKKLKFSINAITYFHPEKEVSVKTEVIPQ